MKLLIFNFLLFSVIAVHAQTEGVSGIISSGKPHSHVAGVTVVIMEKSVSLLSDSSGSYHFENIGPGVYTLEFSCPGYDKMKVEGVKLVEGELNKKLDVRMNRAKVKFMRVQ